MSAKRTGKTKTKSININNSKELKIACVISEWHNEITESFFEGALSKFTNYGVLEKNIDKIYVPGSFELIFATKNLIKKNYDAIITMGCIIKGETKHFDFISAAVINGIKDLNIISEVPIILCISTDNNIEQSIDRSGGKVGNKGADSAEAALKMILINSK
ncbi:MAG: 6,7-dimethyl-8-ribityllumazine synthase [Flavobacteriales bacterium]|nr:MAG: 6,7-dimethyl-8-ribityllumazine synthase [Flavobacteriales bacterium]CAI8314430.1 MAG: 6,7-dimethyl-8-ribityllumazine synthase [Flavobacteriales bacterium]|tara:strand:+ start:3478 stop:3960 length:483 start_codon:yes stop_codon:yes gene_type:complete